MSDPIDRRCFLGIAAATAMSTKLSGQQVEAVATASADRVATDAGGVSRQARSFLTEAGAFVDVSRGNPKPHTLKGEALSRARLTPRTWRLEIVSDGSSAVARPGRGAEPGARVAARGDGGRPGDRRRAGDGHPPIETLGGASGPTSRTRPAAAPRARSGMKRSAAGCTS